LNGTGEGLAAALIMIRIMNHREKGGEKGGEKERERERVG